MLGLLATGTHFLALAELRGGVTGRPAGFSPLNCPYLPLFLSAGFRICREVKGEQRGPVCCPLPGKALTHLEGAHQRLIHAHHGACVVELPTVVGCREEGDELALGKELVAILHHLWGGSTRISLCALSTGPTAPPPPRGQHPLQKSPTASSRANVPSWENLLWYGGQVRPDPSTWCARQMRSRSCLCRNLATTSAPKVKETPRSFSPQPCTSLSGSDQSRSHSRPWSGTSVGRMMRRICSIDCRSGDSPAWDRSVSLRRGAASGPRRQPPALCPPPWQQKIFSSTMAAMGKQLKQSVKVFHSLMLYRRLPARQRSRCSQEPFLWAVLHPPHPPVSHTAHGLAVNPPGGWEAVEVAGMGA